MGGGKEECTVSLSLLVGCWSESHEDSTYLLKDERSQNTFLLVSTQAVYKSPHSTVWRAFMSSRESALDWRTSGSRKSQSIRLEHVAH